MRERLPSGIHDLAYKGRRMYWRLAEPKRFGVKCIVHHPAEDAILVIKNSYGDKNWTLPGGGYKPKHETAEAAARREVLEEVGIVLGASVSLLYEETSQREFKHDSVSVFAAEVDVQQELALSGEIQEALWVPRLGVSEAPELRSAPLSRFVVQAAELLSV